MEIGAIINIDGKNGTVCFLTKYNGKNYVNIAFDNLEYKIYEYDLKDDQVGLALVKDAELLSKLSEIFIADGLCE